MVIWSTPLPVALAAAVWLLANLGCYEMRPKSIQIVSGRPQPRCDELAREELARLGYRPVERVVGSPSIIFSKVIAVQTQTPLNMTPPPPTGGLIALQIKPSEDGGCRIGLTTATYDCFASAAAPAGYQRCELTEGGPPEVDADLDRVASAIANRLKR